MDRKFKYGEATVLVSGFRCPESKAEEFRRMCYSILDGWLVSNSATKTIDKSSKKVSVINPIVSINSFSNRVDVLPRERKMVVDGGLKGLYTANGKWYTNKIIEGELFILEWEDLESAKKYLENLIKL